MARVAFLVTVLAALCYTSQAIPLRIENLEDLEKIKDALKDLTPEKLKDKLQELLNKISSGDETYGIENFGIRGSLKDKIIDGTIKKIKEVEENVKENVKEGMDAVNKGADKLKDKIQGIGDNVKGRLNLKGMLGGTVNEIKKRLDKAGNEIKNGAEKLKGSIGGLIGQIGDLNEKLGGKAKEEIGKLKTQLGKEIDRMSGKAKEFVENAKNKLDELKKISENITVENLKKLKNEIKNMKNDLGNLKEKFNESVKKYLGIVFEKLGDGSLQIKEKGGELLKQLKDTLGNAKGNLGDIIEKAEETLGKLLGGATGELKDFLDKIRGNFGTTIKELTDQIKKIDIDRVIEQLKKRKDEVEAEVKEMLRNLKEIITGVQPPQPQQAGLLGRVGDLLEKIIGSL